MITASVKDAGAASVLNLTAVPSGKVQAPGGADSFQDILNKQTDTANRSDQDTEKTEKPATEKTDKGSQQIPRKDREKDVRPKDESVEPVEETAELPEEIAETMKEAVAQLLIQISDVFGVSVEELRGLMQEMGISESELLLPQQLGYLILEASGAEGSFELVTDGELYEKFRSLMETGEQLAGEVASKAGMSREELIQRLPAEVQAEPVVEIQESEIVSEMPEAMETRETDSQPGTEQGQELQTPGAPQEAPRAESGESGKSGKSGSSQQSSEGEHREIFGGFENNPVARQNPLEATVYEMRTESASQTMDADTQNIMRQILDYMKVQIQPETTSLEMQLHPESLGSLQIQLASKGGAVTAQFIAENEAVKAALETQMIQLRENFEEQGIRVEAIEVSVQTGRFEQAYEDQERGGESQRQSSHARSGRRLRLDAQLTPEQLENLTADEKLAADMMAANGGTVDYMA